MSLYNGERDAALAKPANNIDRWNEDEATTGQTIPLNFAPPRVLPSPGFPSLGLPSAGSPLPPAPPVAARATPTALPARNVDLAAAVPSSTNSKMPLTPSPSSAIEPSASSPSFLSVLFFLSGYLALSGLYDAISVVAPGRVTSTAWRFGVVGAIAPTMVKPILGLCIASFGLLSLNRRLLSISMIVLQVALSAVLVVVIPMFLLDALQVRPVLPENMTGRPFVLNVSIAIAFLVSAIAVQLACARTLFNGLRASKAAQENSSRSGWSE